MNLMNLILKMSVSCTSRLVIASECMSQHIATKIFFHHLFQTFNDIKFLEIDKISDIGPVKHFKNLS